MAYSSDGGNLPSYVVAVQDRADLIGRIGRIIAIVFQINHDSPRLRPLCRQESDARFEREAAEEIGCDCLP
jgi:hypothetical protein